MILAAAAVYGKVKEVRAKKKEAEQGVLKIGDSNVAKRAFASQIVQATRALQNGQTERQQLGPGVKFEDPDSVDATSPAANSPAGLSSPTAETHRMSVTPTPQADASEHALLAVSTPVTPLADALRPRSRGNSEPLRYSALPESSAQSSSEYSKDSDGTTLATSDSASVFASSSQGTYAVKVRTIGSDLKSGFPYHPALFDMQVHPQKWDAFTGQIISTAKFGIADHAQVVATATAVAMFGAFGASVFVGRGMSRRIQEQKVKAGLKDTSDGGLGDTLQQWNESYFRGRGLFVHLELSESAMKRPEQESKLFRRETHWYGNKDERQRKRAERKFVLVVTRLDEDGGPSEALQELSGGTDAAVIPELPGEEDAKYSLTELPGEDGTQPVELAGDMELPWGMSLGYGNEKMEPPMGYAELESDTTQLLGQTSLDDGAKQDMQPPPLMVTGNMHEELKKDST